MEAKKIYEIESPALSVLKPKTRQEIDAMFDPEIRELIDTAYEAISQNKGFRITSDLGYFVGDSGYGFQFEGTTTLTSENHYHEGEFPEYTFGYFSEVGGMQAIFDNNGHSIDINSLEDLFQFIGLDDEQFEPPQGVFENITDVLKPKSEEELKAQFEKDFPTFVEVFKELFPNEEYSLQPEEEGVEANFMFDEGGTMFMVSQNKHHQVPNIFHLDRGAGGERFAGVFKGQTPIQTAKDVHEYVRRNA